MKKIYTLYIFFLLLIFTHGSVFAFGTTSELKTKATAWLEKKNEAGFLENRGQMMDMEGKPVPFVLFKAEAQGLNLWVTQTGITLQTLYKHKEGLTGKDMEEGEAAEFTDWERIDVELKGASIKKENIIKEGASVTDLNYFYPTCPDGIYGVKEYEKITIKDVYHGIDWVIYNSPQKGYKYDFVVHPGSDYKQIELLYKSKTPIRINEQGELELYTQHGNVKENTPVSFYEGQEIITRFRQNYQKPIEINNDKGYETSVSFHLISHISHLPDRQAGLKSLLIIDPQLVWATFYGGNSFDGPMSIDTDNSGNVFVTGYTNTASFPVQNAGAYFDNTLGGTSDIFILKFGNSGNRLWATYYGGTGSFAEKGCSIATDAGGNVFVTGWTESTNLPVQNAGTFFQGAKAAGFNKDAFILKFDNAGNRLWATYYGGTGVEEWASITTDAGGNVFVTGYTTSTDLPVQNASTFFQGANAGGNDAFILKFDNSGNRLWATYYGGTGDDRGYSIATDGSNNVFLTGLTASADFPVQNAVSYFDNTLGGTQDAFVLKFNTSGTRLWATYYGGSDKDHGNSIAIDPSGNVFMMGYTASTDFPVQDAGSYFDATLPTFTIGAFILQFDNPGNRLWATYYGGNAGIPIEPLDNLTIDQCGTVYMGLDVFSYSPSSAASWSAVTQQPSCGYFDNSANGNYENFIVCFSNTGFLLWATFMGGDGYDFRCGLAVDNNRNLFVSGEWMAMNAAGSDASYPLTSPGGGTYYDATSNGTDDGFMARFEPIPPAYTQSQTNAGCSTCNGSATINVSCGNPNYSYVWSNGSTALNTASSTNTITGLCPGTYTVTATSNCNQTQTATFVITGTPCGTCTLTGQFTKGTANCTSCGCKQWIMVTATGGASPYSYLWPDGYTNRYKNDLCPGAYTINIKDKNGCSINVNLTAP